MLIPFQTTALLPVILLALLILAFTLLIERLVGTRVVFVPVNEPQPGVHFEGLNAERRSPEILHRIEARRGSPGLSLHSLDDRRVRNQRRL